MSRRVGIMAVIVVLAIVLLCSLPFFDHLYGTFIIKVLNWQRHFHRQLVGNLVSFTQLPSMILAGALAFLSFGYGVFHAAGPGHGKAVITSYLATQQRHVGRGIALSMLAAFLQALVAIAAVSILVLGLGVATLRAVASTRYLELLSFGLVMVLGVWLMARAWRKLRRLRRLPTRYTGLEWQPASTAPSNALTMKGATPPLQGEVCHCCAGHHVDTTALGVSWRDDLLAVLAMGMRPCSGALLVLGVAALMGQWMIGVMAVLAMALGTGLTVSMLAILTVFARKLVLRVMVGKESQRQRWAETGCWVALAGGALLVFWGGTLAWTAWNTTAAGSILGFQMS